MISCGGGFPRAGRWCTGCEAADPIGVAPSITAGERSHPRTGTTHHSDPMGVELHTDVVQTAGCRPTGVGFSAASIRRAAASLTAGCRPTGVGFSAASIRRAAASLLRGCACGLPAVVGSWTPMGSFFFCCSCPRVRLWLTRGYRKFAPYGGACLTVPPLTARMAPRRGGMPRRGFAPSGETPGWRPSYDELSHAAGSPITLSAARVFNTENRLFSRGCSFARKYAKIRNA